MLGQLTISRSTRSGIIDIIGRLRGLETKKKYRKSSVQELKPYETEESDFSLSTVSAQIKGRRTVVEQAWAIKIMKILKSSFYTSIHQFGSL